MNVLLLSMPDSFEHMPAVAIRMPNGALSSLAGNVDPHHRVVVADLVLVQDRVRDVVARLVREQEPDVVGLSVMTFQRRTAHRLIELVRALRPGVRIVVGGYDPSLAPDAYADPASGAADFIVRGEGELTFRELCRAVESGGGFERIAGLSFRCGDQFTHNPDRPVTGLEGGEIRLPNRDARVLRGYTMVGRQVDVVETSRGCTFDCSFCSIIEMRGRNFHTFSFDRVLADIRDARAHGARSVFLVDDNITLNVRRFEALCGAIVAAGLNDVDYLVQGMTSAIADHGETLAPLMRRAGFRYVFLGIENVLDEDLRFLRAVAKNRRREGGRNAGNATLQAIEYLHRNRMYVVGGLIVGNPDDTPESIEANLDFARRYVDQRAARGVRRHHRGGAERAPRRRGDRVPPLARRTVDEAPPPAAGARAQPPVRASPRDEDAEAHLPREHAPIAAGPRGRAAGLRPLPRHPPGRARLCVRMRWPPPAAPARLRGLRPARGGPPSGWRAPPSGRGG